LPIKYEFRNGHSTRGLKQIEMKKRRRTRRTLSSWLTNRYVLIVRNEENFAEKSTFSFSYAKLIVFVFAVFTVLLFISLYMVRSVLAEWFDPRTLQSETNQKLIELTLTIDSLTQQSEKHVLYLENVKNVISGNLKSVEIPNTLTEEEKMARLNREANFNNTSSIDSQFRKEFEGYGLSMLSTVNYYSIELQELFYFTPVSGIIISSFDPASGHYGVDVLAKDNEPIKAVAEGTVVFSGFTQDYGYTLIIQHKAGVLSVYKHNSVLLEKVGNYVTAGDVIAIIGNTGDLTSGPHLHFELWYNGNPVNPEEFVSF
jgi:murein DD-endopeptidase MepM/ murein hydrolase activator NlpD